MKFLVLKSVQLQKEHWTRSGFLLPGSPLTRSPVYSEGVRPANESVLVPVLKTNHVSHWYTDFEGLIAKECIVCHKILKQEIL